MPNRPKTFFLALFGIGSCFLVVETPAQNPPAAPIIIVQDKASERLKTQLETFSKNPEVTTARREAALLKMMEGQRHGWLAGRLRGRSGLQAAVILSKQSYLRALELLPTLAEGYSALAELELLVRPGEAEVDEAINLAALAVKINENAFGAHRIIARLYSFKSRLTSPTPNREFSDKAIFHWRQVARIDPRNAEAWAFIAAFLDKAGKPEERIEALKKWVSSAPPLETQFYRSAMGPQESLAPEFASLKLASALIDAKRFAEGVEVLLALIADDPDNDPAISMLREAAGPKPGGPEKSAIEAIRRAVTANPANVTLATILSNAYVREGKLDDAVGMFSDSIARVSASNSSAAAALHVALGDMLAGSNRNSDAVTAYESALKSRGMDTAVALTGAEREFAMRVFEKLVRVLKVSNRPDDVRAVVERARKLFGKDDVFIDRLLVSVRTGDGSDRILSANSVLK